MRLMALAPCIPQPTTAPREPSRGNFTPRLLESEKCSITHRVEGLNSISERLIVRRASPIHHSEPELRYIDKIDLAPARFVERIDCGNPVVFTAIQ